MFFISEQIQKYSVRCKWDVTLNKSERLASKMQHVMCLFRSFAIALQGSANDSLKDAHNQIFNKELTDTSKCSREILTICRTLRNALKILTQLISYLRTIR